MLIVFIFLTIPKSNACDPILESLILSKNSYNSIDRLFRDLSTQLAEMGRQARVDQSNPDTLVYAKLVWLKVYEKYYLRPPKTMNRKHWFDSIDKIAKIIKGLALKVQSQDFEEIHKNILQIQNVLISLYDGSQNKSFYSKTRMIKHLLLLAKKSKQAQLWDDLKMINQRIDTEWVEMKSYFNPILQNQLKLENRLLSLQVMNLQEYTLNKDQIFKSLESKYWNQDNTN